MKYFILKGLTPAKIKNKLDSTFGRLVTITFNRGQIGCCIQTWSFAHFLWWIIRWPKNRCNWINLKNIHNVVLNYQAVKVCELSEIANMSTTSYNKHLHVKKLSVQWMHFITANQKHNLIGKKHFFISTIHPLTSWTITAKFHDCASDCCWMHQTHQI